MSIIKPFRLGAYVVRDQQDLTQKQQHRVASAIRNGITVMPREYQCAALGNVQVFKPKRRLLRQSAFMCPEMKVRTAPFGIHRPPLCGTGITRVIVNGGYNDSHYRLLVIKMFSPPVGRVTFFSWKSGSFDISLCKSTASLANPF